VFGPEIKLLANTLVAEDAKDLHTSPARPVLLSSVPARTLVDQDNLLLASKFCAWGLLLTLSDTQGPELEFWLRDSWVTLSSSAPRWP